MRTRRAIGLTLLISVIGIGQANAAWPGDNGRLVAVEPRFDWANCDFGEGGHCDDPPDLPPMIVSQTIDGENKKDLGEGRFPTWSADGKKIAFSRGGDIYKMDADGSGLRGISANAVDEGEPEITDSRPSWNPAGTKVVFQRYTDGVSRKLVVITLDGRPMPKILGRGGSPEWSSQGLIAFIAKKDGVRRVHTVRPDGSERSVVRNTAGATDLSWAPGGRRIAFVTYGSVDRECVRIVDADGGNAKRLTCDINGTDGGDVRGIAWAPNGKSVLVGVEDFIDEPRMTEGHIERIELDGTRTRLHADGYMPDWRPAQ